MSSDGRSLSRATSVSRASRRSSLSRTQSLIKKNIAPHDLRPSDILIERFTAWKIIVNQLIAYFEGIADIQNNVAREMAKLAGVIQVPFRSGNQFLGEGGLQDIYYGIRDKTRAIADEQANLGRTVEGSIVQHLEKLRVEIKAHIKNVQNDTGKLATAVAKERELSAKLVGDLGTSVSILKNTPLHITPRSDPYVANQVVARQLVKQVHTENALQKSLLLTQSSSALFEASLVQALQSAWGTFAEWRTRMDDSIREIWGTLEHDMSSLPPDREWIAFAAREDHLVDPETPLRDPQNIHYPSKDDPSVVAVHTGLLERKKRYTRSYREGYYVLTPAGFLHEYASSDPALVDKPIYSLFLPMCTLGPPSAPSAKSHKFHIEERTDGTGSIKTGSLRGLTSSITGRGSGSGRAWAFRGRSHEDMMEWWNDIRMLCARYLVASEQMERSGPVAAAVRAAGYASEEEMEEEEGSSVEEEREEEEQYEQAPDIADGDMDQTEVPERTRESREPVSYEMREYPTEKKPATSPPLTNGAAGVDNTRGPSKRQLEKAPQGRHPNEVSNGDAEVGSIDNESPDNATAGPAPAESRFTEGL
ncbi:uncharacterized protein LAESUDRAFT_700998 [Laetiporus sulphureus 93-53]|uniref:PH domain-containing protein n=1 Tax=Laetiporus sulphureus 93-53 TaxID=1314785 RepID=A0A165E2A6_9APHY|nr:uncharacterized protein LAESUDRAFT_700998 [Laetiporus sulphureus 93-53]KZT06107.1 hypothetical protein LAESUDRAFT_700998 [Laetiporus sulphureus 93-53]